MARPPQNPLPVPASTRIDLAEKAWMAVVAGLFLLVVMPGFAQGQVARWLRPAMRSVGGVALFLGVVLLVIAFSQARKRKRAGVDAQSLAEGDSAMVFGHDASDIAPTVFAPAPAAYSHSASANDVPRAMTPGSSPARPVAADSPDWSDTELVQPAWADTEFASPAWADTEVIDNNKRAPAAMVAAAPVSAVQSTEWNAAVLSKLDQQGFTAVVRTMFAQAGFTSEILPGNAAAGTDLRLQSRNSPTARITRCQHMSNKPVGETALRTFFETTSAQQTGNGTFATNSLFTAEAVRFARANGIALLDGGALLRQIAKRTPEQQTALLSLALDQSAGSPNAHGIA